MRLYSGVRDFVQTILDEDDQVNVLIFPGTDLPDVPGAYILMSSTGGPGFNLDGAFDAKSWQARCVGQQNDYVHAEHLADIIDIAFTSLPSSKVGGVWVTSIQRVGGAPSPLMEDDAQRTHFVCNYIVDTQSALVS